MAKSKLRSYRFSRNTQVLLARLAKKTGKTQNIVVQRALKLYESSLTEPKEVNMTQEEFDAHIAFIGGIKASLKSSDVPVSKVMDAMNESVLETADLLRRGENLEYHGIKANQTTDRMPAVNPINQD